MTGQDASNIPVASRHRDTRNKIFFFFILFLLNGIFYSFYHFLVFFQTLHFHHNVLPPRNNSMWKLLIFRKLKYFFFRCRGFVRFSFTQVQFYSWVCFLCVLQVPRWIVWIAAGLDLAPERVESIGVGKRPRIVSVSVSVPSSPRILETTRR